MNSLKTFAVMVMLATAGYIAYSAMFQKRGSAPASNETAVFTPPSISLPGGNSVGAPAAQSPSPNISIPDAKAPFVGSTATPSGSVATPTANISVPAVQPSAAQSQLPPSFATPANDASANSVKPYASSAASPSNPSAATAPVADNSAPTSPPNFASTPSATAATNPTSTAPAGGKPISSMPEIAPAASTDYSAAASVSPAATTATPKTIPAAQQTQSSNAVSPLASSIPLASSNNASDLNADRRYTDFNGNLRDETQEKAKLEVQKNFDSVMEAAQKKLEQGKLAEAHLALSWLYDNPGLSDSQRRQLTDLLDQLAGTVIYSRQHLLEPPYVVQPGETLERIAEKYGVPTILLARINGVRDSREVQPGRELKVVHGPFSAVIHLQKRELTLMLQGRYAGRFPLGVGRDLTQLEGEYSVRDKLVRPSYSSPDGMSIGPDDPRNPLGRLLLDLGNRVALHGTNDPRNIGRDDNRGAISLCDRDIDDIYGILTVGSRVVIQR